MFEQEYIPFCGSAKGACCGLKENGPPKMHY